MTTTMVEMEKVIELKKSLNMDIKIMVGGAPVTRAFAKSIGAEGYSRDAIEAARVASELIKHAVKNG
jgi:5-methyltetrahydrofolate--homocysteine methyltransferase